MKFALVSGFQICEVVATQQDQFEVHPGMDWVAVADNTTTQDTYVNGAVVKYVQPEPLPDRAGFTQAVKAAVGGIVASNALAKLYPLFYPAVQEGNWDDVRALIIDAHNTGALTDLQYAGFKIMVVNYHLPISLP